MGRSRTDSTGVTLTSERIIRIALEMVQEGGTDNLSMRKLALRLSVDPMAIYHYLPNKQALLMEVYESVMRQIPVPVVDKADWQDLLRDLAHSFYSVARRYPLVFPHIIRCTYATPTELEIFAAIRTMLADLRLTDAQRQNATRAIYTFSIGLASVAVDGLTTRRGYRPDQAPDEEPCPLRAVNPAGLEAVDFGIDLLISGIEAHLVNN